MVAARLLEHLRSTVQDPALEYAEPPQRITGGFDTATYSFRLSGAPDPFAAPLILRLYRPDDDPQRAAFEATVQNVIAGLGYPAPRVLQCRTETEVLGGAFLVMERLPGRVMLDSILKPSLFTRWPGILAREQARLHALDAGRLSEAVTEAGLDAHLRTPERWLGEMRSRLERAALYGLRPAADWLLDNRPPPPERPAICHGDFHPLNVLMEGDRVSGVVDWAWVTVGDPAFDVGATMALLTQGPVELIPPLRPLMRTGRALLTGRYWSAYRRLHAIELGHVRYYEALRCLGFLVEAGERLLADAGALGQLSKPSAFVAPVVRKSIISRLRKLTGVQLSLPDGPQPQ